LTLKDLAQGKVRTNLSTAGPRGQIHSTLYTVPTGKTGYVKEIICAMIPNTGTVQFELYVLKSGNTDVTAVASDVDLMTRVQSQDANAQILSAKNLTQIVTQVLARNLVLAADDAIKAWVHYGAVTPANTDILYLISGDES